MKRKTSPLLGCFAALIAAACAEPTCPASCPGGTECVPEAAACLQPCAADIDCGEGEVCFMAYCADGDTPYDRADGLPQDPPPGGTDPGGDPDPIPDPDPGPVCPSDTPETCNDGTCTTCSEGCPGTCAYSCGNGRDCSVDCETNTTCNLTVQNANSAALQCSGANCTLTCQDVNGACTATCTNSANCSAEFNRSQGCRMDCLSGSQCLIRCTSTPNPQIMCATGSLQLCIPGQLYACNRNCPPGTPIDDD